MGQYASKYTSAVKVVESVWFDRYVATRKGNCKWCYGAGKRLRTMGLEKDQKPYVRTCPRCKGTGDEPDFGTVATS